MKTIKMMALLLVSLGLIACERDGDSAERPDPADADPVEVGDVADEAEAEAPANPLNDIVEGEHRSDDHRARDRFRNPIETITFFQVEPTDRVIEINPGNGWYMEILAPWLNPEGQYIAASPDPEIEDIPEYFINHARGINQRIEEQSDLYGNAQVQFYDPQQPSLGEPGSADAVLTFRNVHGWVNGGIAEAMFEAFAEVLKSGGTLGVVQHRADDDADPDESVQSGYLPESAVIALAEAAGLEFADRSEINANPGDTRDHPRGVWTLPPSLAMGETDRDAYIDIGESDRMTLRFVKP